MSTGEQHEYVSGHDGPLHRAQEALTVAYEQARISGYAPGTAQMRALLAAEAQYQLLKRESAGPSPAAG